LRQFTRELKKQPGQWYIIQCYSGYENKVKTNLAAEGAEAAEGASNAADAEAASAAEAEGSEDDDYRRRLRQFTRELKKQPGQWYIIQCYSGYENKVKTNL
ncbi:hypothetical protein HT105_23870, partial [Bacteroides fragilis]|nr:hypothetical protein [Bacteroides fragilis]